MDREEVQSRRAYNQIWNGAGRYDIRPEQAAFDAEGDAAARKDIKFLAPLPVFNADGTIKE